MPEDATPSRRLIIRRCVFHTSGIALLALLCPAFMEASLPCCVTIVVAASAAPPCSPCEQIDFRCDGHRSNIFRWPALQLSSVDTDHHLVSWKCRRRVTGASSYVVLELAFLATSPV
eukprot:2019560-Amphidinium_carterae.1